MGCSSICKVAVFLFLTIVTVWLIYWQLIMKRPYLPAFEVKSATVSELNVNVSSLTATWDISLLARNPNPSKYNRKYKIDVDSFRAEVQYHYIGGQVIRLGNTQLCPFSLKEGEEKRLDFKVEAVPEWIGNAVAQQISLDMSSGLVKFAVGFPDRIKWRYKAKLGVTVDYVHEVSCPELDFEFPGNNNGPAY